ncbi:hypothetical protein DPMN_133781 [Dreissena polymorpha]|uniref:B box-type domain-containing protein n=1 Tax=Dreissena polymorpha TaxID=45954 RepID=A0A9D4FV01_DREPO|nr:hypothetical protein DPMN_133781 [Dreissena polymorpha]
MNGMDKGSEHGKGFEFYCEDHFKLCCTTCVLAHRKCYKLDEIASISRQKEAPLHGLKQSLLKLKLKCMMKLFDDAKRELLTEAIALKSEEVKILGKMQSVSAKVMEEINQLLPMCSFIADHGTPQQKFIFSKQVEEKNKTIESKINKQRMTQVSSKVTLSYTGELLLILEMGKQFMKVNLERRGIYLNINTLYT